jgi:hypothetical protein
MDIMIIIQRKGISGLKELTQHLVQNLNFRDWNVNEYEGWCGLFNCTAHGNKYVQVRNSVSDTELCHYLSMFFNLSDSQAMSIVSNLIDLGFLKTSYTRGQLTKDRGFQKLIRPLI